MNPENTHPSPVTYTPGYVRAKIAVIVVGLAVASLGIAQLWRPLQLLLTGSHALAETVRVVKVSPGQADVVLSSDSAIQAEIDRHSRDAVFWNEFRFATAEHREVIARANVGSQAKPLLPLLGADGLPSEARVYYASAHPAQIIVPTFMSTWLAPGMLTFCGLLAAFIGAVLLYWANRPIDLPHIASPSASEPRK